jgi:thymidylate synthase
MAHLVEARTANEAWSQAKRLLLTAPEAVTVESRSGLTTELLHVTLTVKQPRQRWVVAREPAISPAFALAEAVWIVGGRNDADVLKFFNRDLSKYAGEGPAFYGAYGHRLRTQHGFDQLEASYQALASNPGTRQVVLQIWDAKGDHPDSMGRPRSADIPCNTQSLLRIQSGKLYWLQTMRSNDLFRGLPYNLVQFTTLHEIIAGWLGLELGDYTHVVSSLHYYHREQALLQTSGSDEVAFNPDTLALPRKESHSVIAFMNDLISGVAKCTGGVDRFSQQLDAGDCPGAYKNIGNMILAEAARRHGDLNRAAERLAQVANPCLLQLGDRWLSRFRSGTQS